MKEKLNYFPVLLEKKSQSNKHIVKKHKKKYYTEKLSNNIKTSSFFEILWFFVFICLYKSVSTLYLIFTNKWISFGAHSPWISQVPYFYNVTLCLPMPLWQFLLILDISLFLPTLLISVTQGSEQKPFVTLFDNPLLAISHYYFSHTL